MKYINQFGQHIYKFDKATRPFLGIVLQVNGHDYFAPLTSPKPKHNSMNDGLDFIKLQNTKTGQLYGVINLNNMIPVNSSLVTKIDIAKCPIKERNIFLNEMTVILNKKGKIFGNAQRLYDIVQLHPERSPGLVRRCENFTLLEVKCAEYEKVHGLTNTLAPSPSPKTAPLQNSSAISKYCQAEGADISPSSNIKDK
jgi:protein AbiQ